MSKQSHRYEEGTPVVIISRLEGGVKMETFGTIECADGYTEDGEAIYWVARTHRTWSRAGKLIKAHRFAQIGSCVALQGDMAEA